jgi:hypothetical protein
MEQSSRLCGSLASDHAKCAPAQERAGCSPPSLPSPHATGATTCDCGKRYRHGEGSACEVDALETSRRPLAGGRLDRAVLDAYGWSDILPAYDFREQLDESTRLTWAEDTRDEVLARLLELNRVIAAREAEESAAAEGAKPAKKAAAKKKAKKDEATLALPLGKSDPEGT